MHVYNGIMYHYCEKCCEEQEHKNIDDDENESDESESDDDDKSDADTEINECEDGFKVIICTECDTKVKTEADCGECDKYFKMFRCCGTRYKICDCTKYRVGRTIECCFEPCSSSRNYGYIRCDDCDDKIIIWEQDY